MRPPKRLAQALVITLVALGAPGCGMWRAEVGTGAGLGADVKFPALLHTGFGLGDFHHVGYHYGRTSHDDREATASLILYHWEGNLREPIHTQHSCAAFFPPVSTLAHDEYDVDMWSFEFGLMLGMFDVRFGFNPAGGQKERPPRDGEPAGAPVAPVAAR